MHDQQFTNVTPQLRILYLLVAEVTLPLLGQSQLALICLISYTVHFHLFALKFSLNFLFHYFHFSLTHSKTNSKNIRMHAFRSCKDIQEHSLTFFRILEYVGTFQSILELSGKFYNVFQPFELFQNILANWYTILSYLTDFLLKNC